MESRRNVRFVLVAFVLSFALLAAGCGSNNDPADWAEAEEDGTLRENFLRSCTEANTEGSDLTASQASDYCNCAYFSLAEHYSDDFDGFKDAEKRLRDDPTDIDREIQVLFEGCATQG